MGASYVYRVQVGSHDCFTTWENPPGFNNFDNGSTLAVVAHNSGVRWQSSGFLLTPDPAGGGAPNGTVTPLATLFYRSTGGLGDGSIIFCAFDTHDYTGGDAPAFSAGDRPEAISPIVAAVNSGGNVGVGFHNFDMTAHFNAIAALAGFGVNSAIRCAMNPDPATDAGDSTFIETLETGGGNEVRLQVVAGVGSIFAIFVAGVPYGNGATVILPTTTLNNPVTVVVRIENPGDATLNVSAANLGSVTNFQSKDGAPYAINAGNFVEFNLDGRAVNVGTHNTTFTFPNDSDVPSFVLNLQHTVIAPEVEYEDKESNLIPHNNAPAHDMGTVPPSTPVIYSYKCTARDADADIEKIRMNPPDLAAEPGGLVWWGDAGHATDAGGGVCSLLRKRAGSAAGNIIQIAGGLQPAIVDDGGPMIQFDGVNDNMGLAMAAQTIGTIVARVRLPPASPAANSILFFLGTADIGAAVVYQSTNNRLHCGRLSGGALSSSAFFAGASWGSLATLVYTWNAATEQHILRLDGVEVVNSTVGSFADMAGITLAAGYAALFPSATRFRKLAIFNKALSAGELALVEAWAATAINHGYFQLLDKPADASTIPQDSPQTVQVQAADDHDVTASAQILTYYNGVVTPHITNIQFTAETDEPPPDVPADRLFRNRWFGRIRRAATLLVRK